MEKSILGISVKNFLGREKFGNSADFEGRGIPDDDYSSSG